MKNYLDKLIEMYHDLRIYNIELSELSICTKALGGLPEIYRQVKVAAIAFQVNTIPRLTNLLLSSQYDENDRQQDSESRHDLRSLNTEIKSLQKQLQKLREPKYCDLPTKMIARR
jgi:hypothetical protein